MNRWYGVIHAPAGPSSRRPDLTFDAGGWMAVQNFRLGVAGFQEAMGLPAVGVLTPATAAAAEDVWLAGNMLSAHFSIDEFRCTHCGRARVTRDLINLLERIRTELGQPMGKDSSYRCEDHKESRKNPLSEHIVGRAWDPAPDFPRAVARRCGARGIGYAQADNARCTHVDMGLGDRAARPAEFVDN